MECILLSKNFHRVVESARFKICQFKFTVLKMNSEILQIRSCLSYSSTLLLFAQLFKCVVLFVEQRSVLSI